MQVKVHLNLMHLFRLDWISISVLSHVSKEDGQREPTCPALLMSPAAAETALPRFYETQQTGASATKDVTATLSQ